MSLEVDSGHTSKSSSWGAATTGKIQPEAKLEKGATEENQTQLEKLQGSVADLKEIDEHKSSSIGKQRWFGCFRGGR